MKLPIGSLSKAEIAPEDGISSAPLRTVVSRMRGGSDDERVALVIEGGGMSGVVSGGMSVVLEELGLVQYFDLIVGCSAGSLNASYLAAGQAREGAPLYFESVASLGFISKRRALRGSPVMNLSVLFDQHMTYNRPYSDKVLENNPELYLLALNTNEYRLEPLSDFSSTDEVRIATRASCTIPGVTGRPVEFRDALYADGGLMEAVPFHVARSLGATQCLVLRSRGKSYRKLDFTKTEKILSRVLLRGSDKTLKDIVRERNASYNRDADMLASGKDESIYQVCPVDGVYLPDTFESSSQNLLHGMLTGVQAMTRELVYPSFLR